MHGHMLLAETKKTTKSNNFHFFCSMTAIGPKEPAEVPHAIVLHHPAKHLPELPGVLHTTTKMRKGRSRTPAQAQTRHKSTHTSKELGYSKSYLRAQLVPQNELSLGAVHVSDFPDEIGW
eukprot:comp19711_c0_seq1/m.23460 comp19711_c0_seq1/g.23460  ORF comp19711_c0_seq1/g.23460 comp19711_c0_seq1/m.23460 type:complete len:120 (+) comp19711_c0_seq1:431-790(+)